MKTVLRFGLPAVIATAATAGLLLGIVPETTRAEKPVAEACRGCAPSPEDIIAARSGGKSLLKRTVRHAGWRNLGPDLGAVWAPINIDPGGSGTIYTGSVGGGVRRSTDNGVTWSAVNKGIAPRAIYRWLWTQRPRGRLRRCVLAERGRAKRRLQEQRRRS